MNNTAETVENDNVENNEKTESEKFQIGNFQGKTMEQDKEQKHSMSLRLPMKWHRQMEQRAKELNAPVSYVYRMAIARLISHWTEECGADEFPIQKRVLVCSPNNPRSYYEI